jgi:hypothetical protein
MQFMKYLNKVQISFHRRILKSLPLLQNGGAITHLLLACGSVEGVTANPKSFLQGSFIFDQSF